MRIKPIIETFILIALVASSTTSRAQLLKKLSDRLEEKFNNKIEQKADETFDKGLDKVEDGLDTGDQIMVNPKDKGTTLNHAKGEVINCGDYYYLNEHTEVQMTAYDQKGKPSLVITYHISDIKPIPSGMQSTVHSRANDKNGNVIGDGEGTFKCENGDLSADMHLAMSSVPMEQFQGMEVKATKAYLVYPHDMQVGEDLPDGSFHMDIYRKGNLFGQADITIDDRKVEEMVEVTTPAGTWNCFRIAYEVTINMKMRIQIPVHYRVIEWFAPGFGVVKAENYKKKNKLSGYAQLTMVK